MAKLTAKDKVEKMLPILRERHPNARYELDWETPVQLMVGTILAAQCTDERVNKVTKTLFVKYPDAKAFAEADITELEEAVRPTGTYKQKAKAVQNACKGIVERFGGEMPKTVEELTTLPGIARKSANVVLNNAFNIPSGIIVDTHVARVSQRIGLSKQEKPDNIEKDLMPIVPKDQWTFFGPATVLHGRYTCVAKAPKCSECPMTEFCDAFATSDF